MNIFHIIPDFPNNRLYRQLISKLEDKGITNSVYVPSEETELNQSYPIYFLGRSFGLINRLVFFNKQRHMVNDIVRRNLLEKIGVIHAHYLFTAGYCAYKLSRKYNIPYVVSVRNTDVNIFFHYMFHLRFLGVKIMKDASAIVFLSPSYRDYVIKKYVPFKYRECIRGKSMVIPNGINQYFIDNKMLVPKELGNTHNINLIYVGEIDKNKNLVTTLNVCGLLEEKGYNVKFTVVGKIKNEKLIYITSNRFVEYFPHCPIEEVLNHLRESDVFIMPSIHETFGLVYLEAMSQGLPVIYSAGQGFDGYFKQGEVGYSVPCLEPEKIVDCIEKTLKNYTLISGNCINAVESFTWDIISNKYKCIYERIKP